MIEGSQCSQDVVLEQTCEFISGGANTVGTSVVYFNSIDGASLIVYSLSNLIAIGDANSNEVSSTLKGHDVRINDIVHVTYDEHDYVISFGDDGICIIWCYEHADRSWKLICRCGSKSNPILKGTAVSSDLGIIISIADIGGTISSYCYQNGVGHAWLISAMKTPLTQLPKSLHSAIWRPCALSDYGVNTNNNEFILLLFSGGVDSKVHIYSSSSATLESVIAIAKKEATAKPIENSNAGLKVIKNHNLLFTSQCALTGHEDWVGSLSSYLGDKNCMFLASGSQDTFIRIWKIKLNSAVVTASNRSLIHHPMVCVSTDAVEGAAETTVGIVTAALELSLQLTEQQDDDEDEDEDESEGPQEEAAEAVPATTGTGKSKKERKQKYEQTKAVAEAAATKESDASIPKIQIKEESVTEVRASLYSSHSCSTTENETFMSHRMDVTLDALLIGHEEWVTHVEWIEPSSEQDTQRYLFSTSMDRNMIIWLPDVDSGVWSPAVRIGDIGGQLGGSVGGNLLGFVGGCVLHGNSHGTGAAAVSVPRNTASILGIGYGGSFHLWRSGYDSSETGSEAVYMPQYEVLQQRWRPYPSFSGHFGNVTDISWSCDGRYLVSVSSDQTCRLWSRVTRDSSLMLCDGDSDSRAFHWREISRPQIHGYDLTSIALHPSPSTYIPGVSSFMLYSGSDEKVIRCFDVTTSVLEQFQSLCGLYGDALATDIAGVNAESNRIYSAYIPELGLSNKAADLMTPAEQEERKTRCIAELTQSGGGKNGSRARPLEGQLADETIWPEVNKLFGHKNDVVCLASSHYIATADADAVNDADAGVGAIRSKPATWQCLVSSCKSRDSASSSLLLWDLSDPNMRCVGQLQGHDSTVVCIRFSKSNRLIASSGKDRTLCIFESVGSSALHPTKPAYENAVMVKSAHKRIVWDLCWSDDERTLFTASRDGICKIWQITSDDGEGINCQPIGFFNAFGGVSVTSLDCISYNSSSSGGSNLSQNSLLLACGSDNGDIRIFLMKDPADADAGTGSVIDLGTSSNISLIHTTKPDWSHGSTVRRLKWSPVPNVGSADSNCGRYILASCGDDHSVRIFEYTC